MTRQGTILRLFAIWIGGGLAANYAWEMLQMPLYAGMHDGWLRWLRASLADIAILCLLYALMACAAGSWLWFRDAVVARSVALAGVGFLAAVVIELRALAVGKWSYSAAMPLVPFWEVGWSPVLQMMLIPVALAWLSRGAFAGRPGDGARVRL